MATTVTKTLVAWEKLRPIYVVIILLSLFMSAKLHVAQWPAGDEILSVLIWTNLFYFLGFLCEYALFFLRKHRSTRIILFVAGTLGMAILIFTGYESMHY